MKFLNSQSFLALKIGFLVLFFLGVVSLMRYSKTDSFQEGVGLFFGTTSGPSNGSSKSQGAEFKTYSQLNWCLRNTQEVSYLIHPNGEKKAKGGIKQGPQIEIICNLKVSSYEQSELEKPVDKLEWIPMIKSSNNENQEFILLGTADFKFIKFKSMVFKVEGFKETLESVFLEK